MRGISSVVASVILIAVAVVVGVMVSTWVTQWTSTQTSTAPTCAVNTQYVIDSATFTSSTNVTRVKITNRGSNGIYDFELIVDNGTSVVRATELTENPSTSSTSKLAQGNSAFLTYTVLGYYNVSIYSTATEVKVIDASCPSVSAKITSITQA